MNQGVEFNHLMPGMCSMQMEAMAKAEPVQTPAKVGAPSFLEMLSQAADKVNEAQQVSTVMASTFEVGQSSVDSTDAMIVSQKTSVSSQAMTQVHNKLVQAYQGIMQMSV